MQCNQMLPNLTPNGRIATGKNAGLYRCNGTLEASSIVWLDIADGDIIRNRDDSGYTVRVKEVEPSHVNDTYDGMSLDLESRFLVSCAECGHEYEHDFSTEFMAKVGLQPIGNAARVVGGPRGGLNATN